MPRKSQGTHLIVISAKKLIRSTIILFEREAEGVKKIAPHQPKVSIIVLNYNGRKNLGDILTDCVDSVLKTNYPDFEVLFVDNASSDNSVAYLEALYGKDRRLRFIKNDKNLGFAEGNNRGIELANGRYIALLNNDVRVTPNWLTELVKIVEPAGIGAAQSELINMRESDKLDCAGGLLDYYGYHFERGRGEKPSSFGQEAEVFYGKGASVIFKNELLKKTGLFDSDIFMYFDEVDLCWRTWLAGYKVMYAPASVVYHASGSTAAKMMSERRLNLYARNHLMILLKNYELSNLIKAVKASVLFESRNMILFLARRRALASLAIGKALFWNLLHLKATWAKRQFVQNYVRQVSDSEIKKHMLTPCPPFPLYILFPRSKYQKNPSDLMSC